MVNIAIFASGSGSNAENIVRYFESHPCISVALILTNRTDAYVLERAKKLNIPAVVFSKTEMNESDSLLNLLIEKKIDWLVLAGFLLKVPDNLITAFADRILNIHPALLPKYGGKGMYGSRVHEAVVAAGEKESGITIHFVNNHYDEGQIAFQTTCPVLPSDTPDDVANKVHALEYEHFPAVIEKIISDSL